jgi:crotonobetainyl-CoA hydratase
MGMILTGRRVSAEEGAALGFVNDVVAEGEALAGAKRWAGMILECSPMAVRASKEAAYAGLEEATLGEALAKIYPAQQANIDSGDYLEGPKAFAEKRKPNWQNR